jgi:hypothetical protein
MKRIVGMVVLLLGLFANAHAVPPVLNYAGQVTVNGEAFDGAGLFKFVLVNADGTTTYWSNDGTSVDGSEPQASLSVPVNGGLYAVLLGNTAQQGMGPIDPSIFAQHTDAKLRIWFSDGVNGFQQLSPDRPFASVPYAFSAGTAQTAGSATIASGSIDRSMLSGDIRSDLNRTISHNDLSPQIKADINATIGLDRLSAEVILKLEQNATITNGSVTGSKMADGVVTANKISSNTITTNKLNEQILKYLKPEITSQPQAQNVYADTNATFSVIAEGKYLTYQWKKDGVDLVGETNATLNITDANATLHDGNYSVVVSNDFGSVESGEILVDVNTTWSTDGLVGWWKFDETSGTVAYDSSGNGNDGILINGPIWHSGKIGGALSFDGSNDRVKLPYTIFDGFVNSTFALWFLENQNNTDHHHFFSAATTSNSNRFLLGLNSSGKLNYHDDATNDISRITYQYSEALVDWCYIVLVRSMTGSSLYIDGNLKANVSYTNSNLTIVQNGLWLGGDQDSVGGGWSSTQQLNGLLDDVRIYNRALSAEEVQTLYNLGQ